MTANSNNLAIEKSFDVPQISVVIPCHNAAGTIGQLLDGLSRQSLPSEAYEIIVVDDGSHDTSRKIIRQFKNTVLLEQSQQGPGAARNRSTEYIRGEYVLYLDADLKVSETLLECHLKFHETHPEVHATGGSVMPAARLALFSWALVDYLSSWFNAHAGIRTDKEPEYCPSLNFCVKRECVVGADAIHWQDGLLHTGEDVTFCYELKKRGKRLRFLPDAVVYHYDRETAAGYCRHVYRWGYHAPFVRGEIPAACYSFLFPQNLFLLLFTLPLIVIGYTLLIWKAWAGERLLAVSLSVPQILFGRVCYAIGVFRGTWEKKRRKRTENPTGGT